MSKTIKRYGYEFPAPSSVMIKEACGLSREQRWYRRYDLNNEMDALIERTASPNADIYALTDEDLARLKMRCEGQNQLLTQIAALDEADTLHTCPECGGEIRKVIDSIDV